MTIKCETDCRDEIYTRMDGFLPKSILWKVILFVFMVWGVASAIYANGLTERKQAIKEVTASASENTKNIAVIGRDLEYIKTAQTDINAKLDLILREAIIRPAR